MHVPPVCNRGGNRISEIGWSGVFDTNMLVSKRQVKTQEKLEKITQHKKTQNNFSILHYAWGKNMILLRFSRFFLTNNFDCFYTNKRSMRETSTSIAAKLVNAESRLSFL